MAEMHRLVRASLTLPLVWETARRIVQDVPPRDEVGQASAIRSWLAQHVQFINDPLDVQLLTDPSYMLEHIARAGRVLGNCADAAMLGAALCEAIRIPVRFAAVAFRSKNAPYSHVIALALPRQPHGRRALVELDVTRPPGVMHAQFSRALQVDA